MSIASAQAAAQAVKGQTQQSASEVQGTAQNKAQAAVAEAEGQRQAQEALQGLYTDPAYIAYLRALAQQQCAQNSNCTLVITEGAADVNVNTGSPPG